MKLSLLAISLVWGVALGSEVAVGSVGVNSVSEKSSRASQQNTEAYNGIKRAIASAMVSKREFVQDNSTVLDKSWVDAVLLTFPHETEVTGNVGAEAAVEIVCTQCYIKGRASSKFTIDDGDFDFGQTIANFTNDVGETILDIGEQVVGNVTQYFKNLFDNFDDGIDLEDFAFPPMKLDFNVEIPEIPECRLDFKFEDIELYLSLNTILSSSATYNLNLYTSNTPIGLSVGKDLMIGVVYSIDLILSVDGEIDISTGFHLKLDEGVSLSIPLFSNDVSEISMNGGQFEFLPVTIESAGVTFRAVLRVGVRAGFELEPPGPAILGQSLISASAGLEVGVFANVAELVTNVTVSVNDDDEDCRLRVEETYQLALGARAGASVGVQGHTWGPSPETEIPIFYTTLDEGCAMKKSARTASAPSAVTTANKFKARADEEDDWTTTTLTTKVVYEGVACASQGLVYCPASLQRISKFVTTKTLITSVPSGVRATFPENVAATVANAIPFGAGAQLLLATSGSPVSYIPPPPSSTSHDDEPDFVDQATGGVPNRIILGVSIGLGVPILIAAVAAIVIMRKRRRYTPVRTENAMSYTAYGPSAMEPYDSGSNTESKSKSQAIVEARTQ